MESADIKDPIKRTEEVLIGVKDAAEIMGIAYQTLESGLKDHLFTFGTAVRGRSEESFRYVIFKECFMRCLRGEMQPCNMQQPI